MATINLTTSDVTSLNRVQVTIFKRSEDGTYSEFASQIQDPPHPETNWSFDDLVPSENYQYQWTEIDADGNTIQTYATQNFTVPAAGSVQFKPPIDVEVGTYVGANEGGTSIVFPSLIGWDINVEEVGTGTMQRGVTYAWDTATGTFAVLGQGHTFLGGQRYFIRPEPKVIPVAPVISRDLWSNILVVTADITLTTNDIGKKIIIAGTGTHLTITLPEITNCSNRITWFESLNGNHINAVIKTGNANNITWLGGNRTNLYIGRSENIAIYRNGTDWNVHDSEGNFKTVGRMFWSYNETELNAVEVNGAEFNILEYSRLYNDFVLKQNSASLVNYDDWFLGNYGLNQYRFSYANTSGMFRIPDLRGQFMINAGNISGGLFVNPGDFLPQQMIDARVLLFADTSGVGKVEKGKAVAWSTNRQKGNQDYDMLVTDTPTAEATLGLSSALVDQFGNPITTGSKLRPDSIAARLFINI